MEHKKKMMYGGVIGLVVFIILIGILIKKRYVKSPESYCGTTGFRYGEIPELPTPIKTESKSPPFYAIDAPRKPLCAYMNYTMPPPLDVPPPICPDINPRYQYWNSAMLSHPQTPYLI